MPNNSVTPKSQQNLAKQLGLSGDTTNGNNFVCKSQQDLANQLGLDQRQLQNYKKLNELIPELQSLVEILNWDFRKNKIKI